MGVLGGGGQQGFACFCFHRQLPSVPVEDGWHRHGCPCGGGTVRSGRSVPAGSPCVGKTCSHPATGGWTPATVQGRGVKHP